MTNSAIYIKYCTGALLHGVTLSRELVCGIMVHTSLISNGTTIINICD